MNTDHDWKPNGHDHDWKPNGHGRHSRTIGTLTLKQSHEFTQYGSNAADTDYITCEPQTVALMQHGDDYWLCATLAGKVTQTTRRSVTIGKDMAAHLQTQSFGGVKGWIDSELFRIEITHPELAIVEVGKYDDGAPMFAVKAKPTLDPVNIAAAVLTAQAGLGNA